MSYDLNKIIIIGRLTKNPELRYTSNGNAVCSFSIANNQSSKDEDVSFFNCTAWNKTAELIDKQVKGVKLCLEGSLKQRRYEVDGQKRSIVEINVFNIYFLQSKPIETQEQQKINNVNDSEIPY